MDREESLRQALAEIEQWENEQKDLWFWEKWGRLPFVLLDKVTPAFIQEKLGKAVDELAGFVDTGGRYLLNEADVLNRFADGTPSGHGRQSVTLEQVARFPLARMDQVADELRASRANWATLQGATSGVGGVFTLAIDIPLLLGLSLKVLQEMALAYGYNPREKSERVFIVKCLQFSSSDIVGKKAILDELGAFSAGGGRTQMISQLQGWREVALTYRDNFGWKKLFQMVPVAGILFGAYLNRKTVDEVAETGKMLYRKRRVMERLSA